MAWKMGSSKFIERQPFLISRKLMNYKLDVFDLFTLS